MEQNPMRTLILAAALALAGIATAADFRSVGENATVLYDAPSRAATPLYVASRFYPLEVIVNLEAWVKVRDHTGALSWIERRALVERRMVLVTAPVVAVHARSDDSAPVVFNAQQNVALELNEVAAGGWLRVRHSDGVSGYVRATQVWGI
jgi:SH3-like domain-containing protein